MHHLDGDKENNVPENLVVLSVSEHSGIHYPARTCKQCGKKTYNKRYCSTKCMHIGSRKVSRPTQSQLRKDMQVLNWCALGRKYGVSDNAVRKWAASYGLICCGVE